LVIKALAGTMRAWRDQANLAEGPLDPIGTF
jgi:hypothetical protein